MASEAEKNAELAKQQKEASLLIKDKELLLLAERKKLDDQLIKTQMLEKDKALKVLELTEQKLNAQRKDAEVNQLQS